MLRTLIRRSVGDAVVAVGRGSEPHLRDDAETREFFIRAVRHHRLAPLAYRLLRTRQPELAAPLRQDRDRAIHHHLRVAMTLSTISDCLRGIPWLVVKGPALSELAHPVPGLRSYKDVDLLVTPGDLRTACNQLLAAGWNVVDSNETLRSDELSGEVRMAGPARILVDLHWSVIVTRTRRNKFSISTDEMLARAVDFPLGPQRFRTLDPTDSLIHVCLHAALSGATRLLHLLDADQLVRNGTDWEMVVQRAQAWGMTAQLALVLNRARTLFQTPIPRDFQSSLEIAPGLNRFLGFVDDAWPVQILTRDESVPRLVARAVQPSLTGTARSVLRSSVLGVRNRAAATPARGPRIPADHDAIAYYLASVESANHCDSLS